jgi:hypothetical protein
MLHSVLMYVTNPERALDGLVRSVRRNGLVSVLVLNKSALAARSALKQEWLTAKELLTARRAVGPREIPVRSFELKDIELLLGYAGVKVVDWQGVKVFCDSADQSGRDVAEQEMNDLIETEWLAGKRDPYRSIARLLHVVGYCDDVC